MSERQLNEVAGEKHIYLSTKGRSTGKVHTVELWFAFAHGRVYLSHEGEATDWMKNLEKEPQVEFRIAGVAFSGKGSVLGAGDEFERGKIALYEKYYGKASREVIDDWFSLSRVMAIDPR